MLKRNSLHQNILPLKTITRLNGVMRKNLLLFGKPIIFHFSERPGKKETSSALKQNNLNYIVVRIHAGILKSRSLFETVHLLSILTSRLPINRRSILIQPNWNGTSVIVSNC